MGFGADLLKNVVTRA